MKKHSSKEMAMIYNQRLEDVTQKRLQEQKELKHFSRRFTLILLLGIAVLVLFMLTFTPDTVENAGGPAIQHAGQWVSAAKPVAKQVATQAAQTIAHIIQQAVSSASAAIGQ